MIRRLTSLLSLPLKIVIIYGVFKGEMPCLCSFPLSSLSVNSVSNWETEGLMWPELESFDPFSLDCQISLASPPLPAAATNHAHQARRWMGLHQGVTCLRTDNDWLIYAPPQGSHVAESVLIHSRQVDMSDIGSHRSHGSHVRSDRITPANAKTDVRLSVYVFQYASCIRTTMYNPCLW